MTVEHLRRMPSKWAQACARVGVVFGVFLTFAVFMGVSLTEDGGVSLVSNVQADDMGANKAAATGHKKTTMSQLRSKYSAEKGVPGVVPPEGTHNGDDVAQPIDFSHNIHVEQNGMNCLYCHTYARRSNVSGIPPTSKCMGCHSVIATDRPEIQKLTGMWDKGESPKWKKVHDLPDFVHFSHQRHLKKFLFDNPDMDINKTEEVCAMCHGDIKKQTVAKKSKPLTMGFCVRCHQANQGPSDCTKCHK